MPKKPKNEKKEDCDDVGNEGDFDLTILPVRKENNGIPIRRPIHPMLPNLNKGASLLLCSAQNSGKSNLLCNLLLNSNFMKDAFDEVYVFSQTINQDQTTKNLREAYPASCYETFDEGRLLRILDYQRTCEEEERPTIAIILDDLPEMKAKSPFFTLATNYRHYGVALLCYSVQKFTMVPPIVRCQMTNLLVGTNSTHQLKAMASEYQEQVGGEETFMRAHRAAVPKRYNFLYADFGSYPPKMYRNFETNPIWEGEA